MLSLDGLEKWHKSPECQSPEHEVAKSRCRKPAVKNSDTKSKPDDETMVDSDSRSKSSNPVQPDIAILAF
jgi:hypothetical protein